MCDMFQCLICQEDVPEDKITNVCCGSEIPHRVCWGCEYTWRSKMPVDPIQHLRIMKCPMCRQPEDTKKRSIESLTRELQGKYQERDEFVSTSIGALTVLDLSDIPDFSHFSAVGFFADPSSIGTPVRAPVRAPPRSTCASGRDCRSRSRTGRTTTHLKCGGCNVVFCCRNCRRCVGCVPV